MPDTHAPAPNPACPEWEALCPTCRQPITIRYQATSPTSTEGVIYPATPATDPLTALERAVIEWRELEIAQASGKNWSATVTRIREAERKMRAVADQVLAARAAAGREGGA